MTNQNLRDQAFLFLFEHFCSVFSFLEPYILEFEDSEERLLFTMKNLSDEEGQRLIEMISRNRSSEEPIGLETALRLYGAQNAYDFLLAIRFVEAFDGGEFQWDSDSGLPKKKPDELLSYAFQTRDEFSDQSRYHHVCFTTGLVFDVLSELNRRHGKAVKKTETMIQAQYEGGLKLIQVGLKKGKSQKRLELERFIPATILLKRAGRVVFSILFDDYVGFGATVEKNDFRSLFAHLAEDQKYGLSNNMMSAALAKFVPGLSPVSPALLFYDYPFLLKDRVKLEVYELVMLCVDLALDQK